MRALIAILIILNLVFSLSLSAQTKQKTKKKTLPKQTIQQPAKAITPIESLPIMTLLPGQGIKLVSVTNGQGKYLDSIITSKGLLVIFISNNCDYVEKASEHWQSMIKYAKEIGLGYALINTHIANDTMNTPLKMENYAIQHSIRYDYFSDEGALLARLFKVSYLPQVFLFNSDKKLYYSGPIEDNPSEPRLSQKIFIKDAIDAMTSSTILPMPLLLFNKPGCDFDPGKQ